MSLGNLGSLGKGFGRLGTAARAQFTLSDLFTTQDGLAFAIRDATLYQESGKTTAADADGDPIGAALDESGNGYEFLQSTAAARPLLNINGNTWSAVFDGSDDVLSTGSIDAFTGGAVVIAGTDGIWWDNDHDHAGGAFEYGNKSGLNNTYTGGPDGIADIVGELIGVVVRDTALSDAEWAQVLAYFKARGAPGYWSLGSELVTNGDGSSATGWSDARGTGTVTSTGGRIRVTGDTGATTSASQGMTTEVNEYYLISLERFVGTSSGAVYARTANIDTLAAATLSYESDMFAILQATATTTYLGIVAVVGSAGNYSELDNATMKKLTLVTL